MRDILIGLGIVLLALLAVLTIIALYLAFYGAIAYVIVKAIKLAWV